MSVVYTCMYIFRLEFLCASFHHCDRQTSRSLLSLTRHNLLLPHGPLNEMPLAYIGVFTISVFVAHAYIQLFVCALCGDGTELKMFDEKFKEQV